MISKEQNEWINHLSDNDKIMIFPYDPEIPKRFGIIKKIILKVLDKKAELHLKGSSGLGISGQGEMDIYIPILPNKFDTSIKLLAKKFGKPGSLYPQRRVRFVAYVEKTKAEIFLINIESDDWINSQKFESYLREHPNSLNEYKTLKEKGAGLSTRQYYRRKIEFINKILILNKKTV
ncbi:MAG: GrpB family protein [Candidatus Berkelbacteria bacterium]|nr:GrpB family protein [Candidatus Berkelbacteria bacterium]